MIFEDKTACILNSFLRLDRIDSTDTQVQGQTLFTRLQDTEIPTIIDPSATINYPSATWSIIVRISVAYAIRLVRQS
jgi:hypothetical protein